jgi:apolipoprotein N-acyltransferase
MFTYKVTNQLGIFRPPAFRPTRQLGQADAAVRVAAVGGGLILTTLAAGTAWVGIHTGVYGKGFIRVAGWVIGIAGGLAGLAHLAGTVGAAVLPLAAGKSPASPGEMFTSPV